MASLLDGLLGQQGTPDFQTPDAGSYLSAIYGSAPGLARATVGYNNILMPGLAGAARQAEDIYDPNRFNIRLRSGDLINRQLQDPWSLPGGITTFLRGQGLGSGSILGGGPSANTFGSTASLLGRSALDYGNSIINRGAAYGNQTTGQIAPQSLGVTPGDVGNVALGAIQQNNAFNKYKSELDAMNSRNLIQAPLSYLGELTSMGGGIAGSMAGAYGGGYGGNGATPETAGVVGTAGGSSM